MTTKAPRSIRFIVADHRSVRRPLPHSSGPNAIVLAREELRDPPLYTEAILCDKLPFLARLYTRVFPTVFGSNVLEFQHCWKVVKVGQFIIRMGKH